MLSLIAAIGKNGELGRQGQLLYHIPSDMQFFKDITTGHKVLMGRKTWDSLPRKLSDRTNIVVSHHEVKGADMVINDLADFIRKHADSEEEIFIIGGGAIYNEFLPYAKQLYLTEINASTPDADTFFPPFDHSLYTKTPIQSGSFNNLKYTINKYTKS